MTDVDFFSPGARLALELECLLMDTRAAVVARGNRKECGMSQNAKLTALTHQEAHHG